MRRVLSLAAVMSFVIPISAFAQSLNTRWGLRVTVRFRTIRIGTKWAVTRPVPSYGGGPLPQQLSMRCGGLTQTPTPKRS